MKKVIFVCLLSLTTCLSRPDGTQGTTLVPAATNAASPPAVPAAPAKEQTPAVVPPATPVANNASQATPPQPPASSVPQAKTNETSPLPPAVPSETKTENGTESNKTTDKKEPVEPKTETPKPAENATDKASTEKAPAEKKTVTPAPVVPEDKTDKKNETSTPKAEATTKAAIPVKPVEASGRGFDGPSFLGGMILTLGLLAIGFMGFKYYRNQTERNYHTL